MEAPTSGEEEQQSEPWMRYLDDEIIDFEKGSIDEDATVIIRDILAADSISEAAIKEAALRLDKYDKNVRLSYDPMATMIQAARFIPYDNALQDRLIQLLHELMETPTGPDYSDTLSRQLERDWNGIFPSTRFADDNDESRASLREMCDEWVNFSAFKARTLAAGICAHYPEWSFKAPMKDIHIGMGLREDSSGDDVYVDCMLMVAAQHILIAGEALRSQFTEEGASDEGRNPARWRQWTERFREASSWNHVEQRTKVAAGQAHEKMIALWPELFSASSG